MKGKKLVCRQQPLTSIHLFIFWAWHGAGMHLEQDGLALTEFTFFREG